MKFCRKSKLIPESQASSNSPRVRNAKIYMHDEDSGEVNLEQSQQVMKTIQLASSTLEERVALKDWEISNKEQLSGWDNVLHHSSTLNKRKPRHRQVKMKDSSTQF